ncbi:MAG TPA: 1-deoxy-D-xylulose-5-phosphate reductoisomerase, partial [Caulobacteraceae bacterium]|nr:1-deoxy-D-xylulose-5-phosphate reductoisomerase [Caulobacteraceae bacterium]
MARSIVILGSTGSVGVSTLDLLAQAAAHGSADVEVLALAAGGNVALLAEQALAWRPKFVAIADPARLGALRDRLAGSGIEAGGGPAAVIEAAEMG